MRLVTASRFTASLSRLSRTRSKFRPPHGVGDIRRARQRHRPAFTESATLTAPYPPSALRLRATNRPRRSFGVMETNGDAYWRPQTAGSTEVKSHCELLNSVDFPCDFARPAALRATAFKRCCHVVAREPRSPFFHAAAARWNFPMLCRNSLHLDALVSHRRAKWKFPIRNRGRKRGT